MPRLLSRLAILALVGWIAAPPAIQAQGIAEAWNLGTLYPDEAAWQAERQALDDDIARLTAMGGRTGESAATLADIMDLMSAIRGRANRMSVVGILENNVDQLSDEGRAHYLSGTQAEAEAEKAVAPFEYAIAQLGRETADAFLAAEPRLGRHRVRINRIFAIAPHLAGPEAQAVLAATSRWPFSFGDARDELLISDLGWAEVTLASGETVKADPGVYTRTRRSAAPEDRAAALAHLRRLRELADVFALLQVRRISADRTIAQARHFPDPMTAGFKLRENLPPEAVPQAIKAARSALPDLQRFVALRRRVIGLTGAPHAFDLWTTTAPLAGSFTLADATANALEALAPLGEDFGARLREAIAQPHFHLIAAPNKSGIFAVFPPVGGLPCYVVATHVDTVQGSRRLTTGLAAKVFMESTVNGFVWDTRDDAGILSNMNIYAAGVLHEELMIRRAANAEERAKAIVLSLDVMLRSFFTVALRQELEMWIEDEIEAGRAPDGDAISERYLQLMRDYHGAAIELPPEIGAEWIGDSVPFSSIEHLFWPPAYAAGVALAERIAAGDTSARAAMFGTFGAFDTDRTQEVLAGVGIDLTRPDAYAPLLARLARKLADLEAALSEMGR